MERKSDKSEDKLINSTTIVVKLYLVLSKKSLIMQSAKLDSPDKNLVAIFITNNYRGKSTVATS